MAKRCPWVFVLAVLASSVAVTPSAAQSAKDRVVTAAVQVTPNPTAVRAHSSPQIAVNPKNGELVVVESDIQAIRNDPEGRRGCNVHISADGGRTWFRGGNAMMKPYTECSRVVINGPYATLAFDKNGVLYVAHTASDPKFANPHPPASIPRHVVLARSTDGGRTFQTTMVYKGPEEASETAGDLPVTGQNGRAMVAVDPSDSSRVYVAWAQSGSGTKEKAKSLIAASADGGKTFAAPVDVSDPRGASQPRPTVDGDGAVHVLYLSGSFGLPRSEPQAPPVPRPVYHRESSDGGKTWSEPVEVDPGVGAHRKWLLAADPKSKALYAVWYGNPTKPEADIREQDYLDVFLRVSMDGGKTWSEARTVNEGGRSDKGVKRYDPAISITPSGRVDIAWYDFRNSPVPEGVGNYDFNVGGFQDVYYTSSTDNGRTFQRPDTRITDRIIDRNVGVWSNNFHSHTNVGMTSTDEGVFFAWQDSRNGNAETNAEDVYFASAGPAGSARLEASLATDSDDSGVPGWALALTSGAVGMGIATLMFLFMGRRRDVTASGRG
ncbi:MAG: glycoside hydrolase [Actinomycetota bacterium]|nr:glycoside hydrolase [Actinomycetota bacterium]